MKLRFWLEAFSTPAAKPDPEQVFSLGSADLRPQTKFSASLRIEHLFPKSPSAG